MEKIQKPCDSTKKIKFSVRIHVLECELKILKFPLHRLSSSAKRHFIPLHAS